MWLTAGVARARLGLSIGSTIDVEGVTPGSFNVNDVDPEMTSSTNTIQYAQSSANTRASGGKIDKLH